jgi:histidine triad (HIT) family protein
MSTIFSKIIAGELPCHKVYENDHVIAFLDIHPIQPGHTLIVPKVASENGLAADPEDLAHIMKAAKVIGNALINIIGCDGINFLMNNGEAAGQKVFHTHLHIIPRFDNDGVYEQPLPGEYEEGEVEHLALAISKEINER